MFTLVSADAQATITAARAAELINDEPEPPTAKRGAIDGRTLIKLPSARLLIIGPAMQRTADTIQTLRDNGARL